MELDVLVLFFKPLLADRMDFREWETFFFGTANKMDGKNSSKESTSDLHEMISAEVERDRADFSERIEVDVDVEGRHGRDHMGRKYGWRRREEMERRERRA